MNVQLTILGLGQIGTSIGMAMKSFPGEIQLVGYDRSKKAIDHAKAIQAIDKAVNNLKSAVKDADIVLLALPFHEIHSVLDQIAPELKEEALILDTGPLKKPVLRWVEELLPENRYYVGLTPVVQTCYLEELSSGGATAREDLFSGCLMGLVSRQGTEEKAIALAVELVETLGASPYFTDPIEIDGLMTMTFLMPRIMAASLLKSTQDAPGWREARKIAGKAFSWMTHPLFEEDLPGMIAAVMSHNAENTCRVVNDLIRTLLEIRELTESSKEKYLEELFHTLQMQRQLWWEERQANPWIEPSRTRIPDKESAISRFLGFSKPDSRRKEDGN